MVTHKHGEMGWNDEALGGGEKGKGKDQWLRLKNGSNLIRVLTLPHQFYQHRHKLAENEKGFGHRIKCSAKNGFCPVCAKGDKPKKRWLLGVIDRNSNTYKILEVGWSVLSDIKTYAEDDDWGDTSQYDFDIVVNPNAPAIGYYKAVAKPKKPLSAQDLVLKEQMNLEELAKLCAPPDPKAVEARLNTLMQEFLKTGGAQERAQIEKPVSFVTNTKTSTSDEDEEDFPDSDTKSFAAPF